MRESQRGGIVRGGRGAKSQIENKGLLEKNHASLTHIQYLRQELSKSLRPKFGVYENESTGIKANLNGRSLKKLSSDKAVEKSKANGFTLAEHFESAEKITSLYKKAKLVEVAKDKKGSSNILSIKRFSANFRLKEGRNAKAYITVKESIQNGHTIYSVELFNLE